MRPRERLAHCSSASEAPTGHSAPMPIPSSARKKNRKAKLGEKPAMKLQIEYQRIEIISGIFRPTRSASQPEATAPTKRIHRVMANTAVTAGNGTLNSCAIGTMISRKMVKSKASSVQPSHAAHQAVHWSLVGSFHQGIDGVLPTAVAIICSPSPEYVIRTIVAARAARHLRTDGCTRQRKSCAAETLGSGNAGGHTGR